MRRPAFLPALLLAPLLALPLALPPAAFAGGHRELTVAAVQLHVDAEALSSPSAYEQVLRRAAGEATRGKQVDLIVFPEYTAAFFALASAGSSLAGAATAELLLASLRASDPSLQSPAAFFAARADGAEAWTREVFGSLAREHRAWVLAGTAFAPDGAGGLRNRAIVFGPEGGIAYTQDKVFLTEIEEQLLGMSGGAVSAATGFDIRGYAVRLTVCRDTFETVWEQRHRGADLWIDIKANGVAFTAEERASFQRALPARLGPSGARTGLTVCLTGALLEFVWEGESSFIQASPDGVRVLEKTPSASQGGAMLVRIPPRRR